MSQRAAALQANTLQKHTLSRGKREKQTTTQITHMEHERTEARRLEKKTKTDGRVPGRMAHERQHTKDEAGETQDGKHTQPRTIIEARQ